MKTLITILLIMTSLLLFGQSTDDYITIEGRVKHFKENEDVIGGRVQAIGSQEEVLTDIDGRYRIKVPKTVTKLKFSYEFKSTPCISEVVDINRAEIINLELFYKKHSRKRKNLGQVVYRSNFRAENNTTLVWLNPNPDENTSLNSTKKSINIKVKATKNGLNQNDFTVYLNNDEMTCKLGEQSLIGSTFSASVCLNTGNNEIKVCYENNCTETLNVRYQPQKPNLHLLSIGPSFPDLNYTTKDATDFANLFQDQTKLYNQRNINILKSDKATASKMKTELSRLRVQYKSSVVSRQDVLMVFISSHGIVLDDDQQVRIKGADYDPIDKEATTVAFTEIITRLDKIECKKIIFIDACFSGVLDPKLLASKSETSQIEVAKALKILTQKQNGWTIFSSSGNEVSWEHSDWQNGAFTEAIIEGLKYRKADYNDNKIITTTELYRYINQRVPKLNTTKGFPKQYPQMENNLGDLPIFAY